MSDRFARKVAISAPATSPSQAICQHLLIHLDTANGRALVERIAMALGYSRLSSGSLWRATFAAIDEASTHVLLVVDLNEPRRVPLDEVRYPAATLSPARIRSLKSSASAWLFDNPEADAVRVDYLVLPCDLPDHGPISKVPITYARGVAWHHGSCLSPTAR